MTEAKRAEAVAALLSDAARAVDAALALGVQGWTSEDARGSIVRASDRIAVAHRDALLAIGDAQE